MAFKVGIQTFVWIKDGPLIKRLFATQACEDRNLETLPFITTLFGKDPGGKIVQLLIMPSSKIQKA